MTPSETAYRKYVYPRCDEISTETAPLFFTPPTLPPSLSLPTHCTPFPPPILVVKAHATLVIASVPGFIFIPVGVPLSGLSLYLPMPVVVIDGAQLSLLSLSTYS